jgi:hypothetical protein
LSEAIEETKDLPVGDPATFIGEIEEMDLSALKDKTFMVAVSTGKRESAIFLSQTIRGPFTFVEMVQEVSNILTEQQLHAHVIIPQKDRDEPNEFLDECTIDFIEARAEDLITAAWLDGLMSTDYTCKAGIITDPENDVGGEDSEETTEQD